MLKVRGCNTTNKLFTLFDHVCRSDSWIKKCSQYKMAGKREHGRPWKAWQQCVNCDLKSLKLSKDLTSNGNAWRDTKNGGKPNPQKMLNIGSIRISKYVLTRKQNKSHISKPIYILCKTICFLKLKSSSKYSFCLKSFVFQPY